MLGTPGGEDLGSSHTPHPADPPRKSISEAAGAPQEESSPTSCPPGAPHDSEETPEDGGDSLEYPDEFQPLRSRGPPARFDLPPAPLARNPYMSPLLAPDGMLGGLPPVHLVVSPPRPPQPPQGGRRHRHPPHP